MSSNYQELLAQREALLRQQADIDRQLAAARKAGQSEVITQIKALMHDHGITAEDLNGQARSGTKQSKAKGSTVAAKYRDQATGETWSGRGKRPRWLASAIAGGRQLQDFAV